MNKIKFGVCKYNNIYSKSRYSMNNKRKIMKKRELGRKQEDVA